MAFGGDHHEEKINLPDRSENRETDVDTWSQVPMYCCLSNRHAECCGFRKATISHLEPLGFALLDHAGALLEFLNIQVTDRR